jgi:hypothetical protein
MVMNGKPTENVTVSIGIESIKATYVYVTYIINIINKTLREEVIALFSFDETRVA